MATLYFVGRGVPSFRDRRNWSRRSGGPGGATPPTGSDTVILNAASGEGVADLTGMPHRKLTISGFRGTVHLPNGGTMNRPARARALALESSLPSRLFSIACDEIRQFARITFCVYAP